MWKVPIGQERVSWGLTETDFHVLYWIWEEFRRRSYGIFFFFFFFLLCCLFFFFLFFLRLFSFFCSSLNFLLRSSSYLIFLVLRSNWNSQHLVMIITLPIFCFLFCPFSVVEETQQKEFVLSWKIESWRKRRRRLDHCRKLSPNLSNDFLLSATWKEMDLVFDDFLLLLHMTVS